MGMIMTGRTQRARGLPEVLFDLRLLRCRTPPADQAVSWARKRVLTWPWMSQVPKCQELRCLKKATLRTNQRIGPGIGGLGASAC